MNLYYRPELHDMPEGVALELRARFAWTLLNNNGILMASPAGEDSTGRAKMEPMPASDLVKRSLDVAEAFIATCEERGYLCVPHMSEEDAARRAGILEGIKSRAAYKHARDEAAAEKTRTTEPAP